MADHRSLGLQEFVWDLRGVIAAPRRRFPLIHDRDVLWGSLLLLLAPAYFGFTFAGGVFFRSDPVPGYSFFIPLVPATVLSLLKLYSIHLLARLFEGRGRYGAAKGTFRELLVVFGYTGVPAILAMVVSLFVFLTFPERIGSLFRDFRVLAISAAVALGLALFLWNLILMVLALRTVYAVRDWKLVVSVLAGPLIFGGLAAALGSLAVSGAKIDARYMRPVLSERIAAAFAEETASRRSGEVKVSAHLDHLAYRAGLPQQFDLVAWLPARDLEDERLRTGILRLFSHPSDLRMGRIVALPGDEFELVEGRLRVNGRFWAEPYIPADFRSRTSLPPGRLGPSEYLLLPEDRRMVESLQGELRMSREQLYGRLIVTKWPLGWFLFRPTVFFEPYAVQDR